MTLGLVKNVDISCDFGKNMYNRTWSIESGIDSMIKTIELNGIQSGSCKNNIRKAEMARQK